MEKYITGLKLNDFTGLELFYGRKPKGMIEIKPGLYKPIFEIDLK